LTGLRENAGPFFVGRIQSRDFRINFAQGAKFFAEKERKNFHIEKRPASLRLRPARLLAKLYFALAGLTLGHLSLVSRSAMVP